jgi:hypothetical protein
MGLASWAVVLTTALLWLPSADPCVLRLESMLVDRHDD